MDVSAYDALSPDNKNFLAEQIDRFLEDRQRHAVQPSPPAAQVIAQFRKLSLEHQAAVDEWIARVLGTG